MPECQNCGSHLTPEYVRVFGMEGEVSVCLHCTTNKEAREAARDA